MIAVSTSVKVAPSAVSIRRILDVSFPLSPTVLWINPLFAGDDFSTARRRLQGGSTGSVSVDMQIKVINTAAASSLTLSLSSSISTLAADVKQSLASQSSPLSAAELSVTIQPYLNPTTTNKDNKNSEASSSSFYLIAISASTFVAGVILATIITSVCLYYKFKRRAEALVVPENYVEVPVSSVHENSNKPNQVDDE